MVVGAVVRNRRKGKTTDFDTYENATTRRNLQKKLCKNIARLLVYGKGQLTAGDGSPRKDSKEESEGECVLPH